MHYWVVNIVYCTWNQCQNEIKIKTTLEKQQKCSDISRKSLACKIDERKSTKNKTEITNWFKRKYDWFGK